MEELKNLKEKLENTVETMQKDGLNNLVRYVENDLQAVNRVIELLQK